MAKREIGKVKWFDAKKGYGFISRKDADDVFVHYTAIQGKGYRVLKDDQEVEFNIVQGKKGLEARNLIVVDEQEQTQEQEQEQEQEQAQEQAQEQEEEQEDKNESEDE